MKGIHGEEYLDAILCVVQGKRAGREFERDYLGSIEVMLVFAYRLIVCVAFQSPLLVADFVVWVGWLVGCVRR